MGEEELDLIDAEIDLMLAETSLEWVRAHAADLVANDPSWNHVRDAGELASRLAMMFLVVDGVSRATQAAVACRVELSAAAKRRETGDLLIADPVTGATEVLIREEPVEETVLEATRRVGVGSHALLGLLADELGKVGVSVSTRAVRLSESQLSAERSDSSLLWQSQPEWIITETIEPIEGEG